MVADVLLIDDVGVSTLLDVVVREQCLNGVAILRWVSTDVRENFDCARAGVRLDVPLDPFEDPVAHGDHLQSSHVD